ncbi:MAG: hypothetical protein SFX73_24350 [Kofleriaceae bacterium]|nr:hypothetical protein [Kofleriaceae bacterium]
MGRGISFLLVAGALAFGSTACRPLYGDKPEKLRNPEKKKRPPEAPEAEVKIVYVEECQADFRGDPAKARPQPSMATSLVGEGETALQSAEKAKDPSSQAELIKVGIDKFRNALLRDPYNAEATLALALAYDKVLRKGCSIAMLKRLATLESNPKYAKSAKLAADRVTDNESWFKGYRKDAISALGR